MENRQKMKKWIYVLGVLVLILITNTSFSIPCIWKLLFGMPCSGCGLTRAFILASQLKFFEAVTMNILFLPLAIGTAAYFMCVLIDTFFDKKAVIGFNLILSKKWFFVFAVILTGLSWYYNIIRGI